MRIMFDDASAVADVLAIAYAAIGKEKVIFRASRNGITMSCTDAAHVTMAEVKLELERDEKGALRNVAHITAADLPTEGEAECHVRLSLLLSAVKKFGREPLIIDTDGEPCKGHVLLVNPQTEIYIPKEESNRVNVVSVTMKGLEKVMVPYKILKKVATMCRMSASDVSIRLDKSKVSFYMEGDANDYGDKCSWETIYWVPGEYGPCTSKFSAEIVRQILSAVKPKPEGVASMEIGDDYPIRFTFREGACELAVLIAPRVDG